MEVTALCIRLLMNVLFLPCALDHKVDSVSLRVEPNKLQFIEYESVTFHCDGFGSSGWKMVHEVKKDSQCRTTSWHSSCIMKNLYPEESGLYWCETGNGEKSNSLNITVTGVGSVILESPALPVMEGDIVTLRCRNKNTSSNLPTGFYKDGVLIRSSSAGEITIHRVSKSDEGLYKCNISDVGESAESWLTVREETKEENGDGSTPWIIVTVLLVTLLLVVGLRHYGRTHWDRVLLYLSRLKPASGSAEAQTVQVEASAAVEDRPIYATVRKNNNKKKDEGKSLSSPEYYILGEDETRQPAEPATVPFYVLATGVTNQPLPEDTYASIP